MIGSPIWPTPIATVAAAAAARLRMWCQRFPSIMQAHQPLIVIQLRLVCNVHYDRGRLDIINEFLILAFIPDISIAPLQVHFYSDIDTVSKLTHRSATGNYEWRTCPRSLRGGKSGIWTCDLPDARLQTFHWATTSHEVTFSFCVTVLWCYINHYYNNY